MRTITVTEKHKAVNEGRMSKSEFVRQMRQSYPMYISPQNGYDATVQILKNKQMLFEEKEYEVDDTFKYSDDSLRRAIDIELEAMGLMSHGTISMEDQDKAKKKAIANLKKDPLHYYHLISGDSSKVNKHDKPVEVKKGNEVDTFNGMKKATLKEAKQNLEEGTRALVGYLFGDILTTTYNHYDGYPSNLGKGLMTHYNTKDKAEDIAMKGYITSMDPDTGDISATHSDPARKVHLDDDAQERAKEIAEEIDSMGADYGYIWDDESSNWVTIKNTGIRSMTDQIMDKLSMMNVYSGDKMNEVPAEEAVAEPTLKERLREALSDPAKLKIAKAIKAKYPIITARDIDTFLDMHGKDIDNGADPMDEFEEFFHANYEGPSDMEEKKVNEQELSPNNVVWNWSGDRNELEQVPPKFKAAVRAGLGDQIDDKDFEFAFDGIKNSFADEAGRGSMKFNSDHWVEMIEMDFLQEKKGKDHDGDGDIDSDDYMAAKDKAIKKAMGKDVDEAAGDDEHMVHELIGDLFAPGNARSHLDFSVEVIAKALEDYKEGLTRQGVKDAMDLYDKLAADGTLDKEVEDGNGFISSKHVPKLKKAFELIGLYGNGINESVVKKNIKSIITKILEEEVINEAATNDLAKIADEYEDFGGLKPAVISLQNIVTEIESFYDKTREKIQKVYDALGNVTNDEGLKVGAFITPSIENAFKRDLKHIIKNQFTGGLNMPQVRRISQDDIDRGTVQQEAPKDTVFSPVNEKKNKNEK